MSYSLKAVGGALALLVPAVLGHNFVVCTNAFPNITGLLGDTPRPDIVNPKGDCYGYPRAYPAEGTKEADMFGDQGWPWQGIWPLHDGAALKNHRVCNWLQEKPDYDPTHPPTHVKPESTIFIQVQTNNHPHEYAERPSGHHKIFLAGPSGTQLTTANQLTFDRVVFSAPANKYAHIQGEPNFAGYSGDPGYVWLPLKLVDPTGAYLPEGTYNFIFTYFWATDAKPQTDYMIPDYSSSFDIVITKKANNSGAVTDCVNDKPDCATYLIGESSSPGAKDHTSPWPPYKGNYLFTNFDGDDPSTDNGKRTFQPYWTDFVEASKAPKIASKVVPSISTFSEDELLAPIPIAGGNATFPDDVKDYPNMPAGGGESISVTQILKPLSIVGSILSKRMTGRVHARDLH